MQDKTFAEMITFTRSGSATYIDANGFLQVAASNQPRFDYTHGRSGLRLEGSATNLCVNKDITLLTSGANTIVTHMPAEVGPDGVTGNVYRVQMPAAGDTFVRFANAVGGGGPICMSAYVKQYDPTDRQFSFGIDLETAVFEAGESWQRYESSYATSIGSIALGNNTSSSEQDTYASDILVAFPQVETRLFATSYIPTTGTTVTRPADLAQLSETVAALLRRSEASVLIQGQTARGSSGRFIGGTSSTRLLGFNSAQNAIVAGSSATLSLGAITVPLPDFGVALGYDAAGKRGSYNGSSVTSDSVAMDATLTNAYIGRDNIGNFAQGWYYQIAIWPFRMTDADLQAKAVTYA